MVDWMKANPAFSMDDYMWKLSVPFSRIMAADATQVAYLSDRQKEEYKKRKSKSGDKVYEDPMEFAKALGIPVIQQ